MSDIIKLGLMPPLSGIVEIYGREIVMAAQIACDEINERGGVLGKALKLVIEDDGSMPGTAAPAAQRLIDQHGCIALIGNLLSSARIAVVAQVAEPRKIPLLNFSFYEGSINSRYFFNFAALPNQQIDRMIPFMARRYGPKLFFAGNNYEWPRGSIDAAKRSLRRTGGEIVGEEYLPIGAQAAQIDDLLVKVKNAGADVFVPYFAGDDQIRLLKRFTELGLKSRMAVVMGHYDEMMASYLPPEVRQGFYSSNTYFMSVDSEANRQYLQKLVRQPGVTGIWPNGNGILTNFGEGAYLCVQAFANALTAAGSSSPEALLDALKTVGVDGPQGRVEMDRTTQHASVNNYLARCDAAGYFHIVERFGRTPPVIPARYSEQFKARQQDPVTTPASNTSLETKSQGGRTEADTAHQILSIADVAIIATNAEGVIRKANYLATQTFGYDDGELIGMSIHLLLPPHFRQRHAVLMREFVASDDNERSMSGRNEVMGYRKDGSFFPIEASIAKFHSHSDWTLVVTLRDITERKKAENELMRQITHDALTGLPNRTLIRDRLIALLQRSKYSDQSIALLFIDLDGFKLVNDTHSHEAGDKLLQMVSSRLVDMVRPGDTVARLAGDEFVILCEQINQPDAMATLAQRINDSLRQAFRIGDLQFFISASIGIAIGNGKTHSADDMLRNADTAMYAVKDGGRDGWKYFNQNLHIQAKQRLSIANGLRTAIENNELSPRFQPIVHAESGRIVGAELLLRWNPPHGEISPGTFIPIAESTNIIVPIGAWVFREACRAEAEWRGRWGKNAPYISVNVSTRQLSEENLADDFAGILSETGADPTRLLLEITETSLMADVDSNLRVLRRLAALGLRVAVDDFGTGYSSLAQLSRMPVHVLKIDRAFVDGIDKSEESRTIIRAVISLGRALGLKLVAEGVENAAQQLELCSYGCDLIQGYHFHRPLMKDVFIETYERESASELTLAGGDLHFLIYVSHKTGDLQVDDFSPLLQQTNSNNRRLGISGCLLYQHGCFMQMIEGKRATVLGLIDKIKTDKRHQDVKIVIEAPCKRRLFTHWGMLFRNLSLENKAVDLQVFTPWQDQPVGFFDLAKDPLTCYSYITAYAASDQPSKN